MVAKPAPTTPLTTLLLGEILQKFLPAGVVNIIADQNELGPLLSSHPDVAKIGFTGSTATGKKVMASAAGSVKRVTLELGGNDAAIVLDDMPAKLAAQKVYQGAMTNAGQICVAIKRAYVHESLYEEFLAEITSLATAAVVDEGTKQGVTIGPVQNKMQFDKVSELLADAQPRPDPRWGHAPRSAGLLFLPPSLPGSMTMRRSCERSNSVPFCRS
jgi:acyl-CoA reductase-like NAD-dependent aldehyde dehydrogenase